MFVVIGSGPAGIACARVLLDNGRRVLLLDAGFTLEPEKEQPIAPLRTQRRDEWSDDALKLLRGSVQPKVSGLPSKLVYGSDFPYQAAERELRIERTRVDCVPTFARGGMSNVWGASILPYRDEDIDEWPIRASDLAAHYRAVLSFVPHSAVSDSLEALFPTYSETGGSAGRRPNCWRIRTRPPRSSRGTALCSGGNRLAVDSDCIRCGLCMYGCPKELVFSSAYELLRLMSRPGFTYRPGVILERIWESGGEAILETRAISGGSREAFRGERARVACGPLSTTRLMLTSLEAYDREVPLGALLGRMWIAQGHLHSALSPGISAVLTNPSNGGGSRFLLTAMKSPEAASRVRRVVRKFFAARGAFRMVPIEPALKLGDPGRGYHVGGSFPMRTRPGFRTRASRRRDDVPVASREHRDADGARQCASHHASPEVAL
jgi:ferredoxin